MKYKNIDIVSLGEGEYTLSDLLKKISQGEDYRSVEGIAYRHNSKVVSNPNTNNCVYDLNELPWPCRDFAKESIKQNGLFPMISSRGCYANCKFCAINAFTSKFEYTKWRPRNIYDVVEEMKHGVEVLKAKYVLFCDDNFIGPGKLGKERLKKFSNLLEESQVRCEFGIFCRANDIILSKYHLLQA